MTSEADGPEPRPLAICLTDWLLVVAFLSLTFLLGVFPLKDTDFWWHLRTGDLIRQTGQVPHSDIYTYTLPPGSRWVDLHWGFQVALSWGYARGGVVALNLAKCAITCAAMLLLVSSRRRDWPVWAMLLVWLPALLVLSGRMYVRPETVSLLFLACYLAILFRWERAPWLAMALPLIQVLWVNVQGLFVLGPILLLFALLDAAIRPGSFAPGRRRWWRIVGLATFLTGLACLVNPYGLTGALYPLELARTMRNPIFSRSIGELTPIPLFIQRSVGLGNLPLRLHLATMILGALSFLVPMAWSVAVRLRHRFDSDALEKAMKLVSEPADPKGEGRPKRGGKSKKAARDAAWRGSGWRLSLFRLLLFFAFSALSWQATRNSHQFAAVVGTLTAWNFGEWAAAVRRRREARDGGSGDGAWRGGFLPRVATLTCIALLFAAVASGQFYAMAGEGRTIGLGEEPLWFPHHAVEFAGSLGMPERFLGFHDGYAALYEYYHGPARKVFADARLEVIGAKLYEQYLDLRAQITEDRPGWGRELDKDGRPAILAGHADSATLGAVVMSSPRWRCVWFDPIVAVFAHDAYAGAVASHAVDFAARHFRPDPATDPRGVRALLASAKAMWAYAGTLQARNRADMARPLVLLGLDYGHRVRLADPDSPAGWKILGQLELSREAPSTEPVPRYRLPFDPVFDLSPVRATYALRKALEAAPEDFMTLLLIARSFADRGMADAELPYLERLVLLRPINPEQAAILETAAARIVQLRARLVTAPPATWENLSELDQIVATQLAEGRPVSAAKFLERAYPAEPRPWEVADRLGIIRLHLGEPALARSSWEKADAPPRPAERTARVALTHLVEGSIEAARKGYRAAIADDSGLFEAHYGLAVLEQDAGRAREALAEAHEAAALAPGDVARDAARAIVALVSPYGDGEEKTDHGDHGEERRGEKN
jgi:tetratricopeptide (TPR) repeat protein